MIASSLSASGCDTIRAAILAFARALTWADRSRVQPRRLASPLSAAGLIPCFLATVAADGTPARKSASSCSISLTFVGLAICYVNDAVHKHSFVNIPKYNLSLIQVNQPIPNPLCHTAGHTIFFIHRSQIINKYLCLDHNHLLMILPETIKNRDFTRTTCPL